MPRTDDVAPLATTGIHHESRLLPAAGAAQGRVMSPRPFANNTALRRIKEVHNTAPCGWRVNLARRQNRRGCRVFAASAVRFNQSPQCASERRKNVGPPPACQPDQQRAKSYRM